MVNLKRITSDLIWIGADDRRLMLFEGVYSVPRGVSYNSYLLSDDTTVLFDTVDKAVSSLFFENLSAALGDRPLDYVVVHHMEPDHTAVLKDLLSYHPETTVVCSAKAKEMLLRFFPDFEIGDRVWTVKEGETLFTGHHELTFVMAPMVHWPEVMVSYDKTEGILFSADAFGHFGALNGAIFADEVDFDRDYLSEARRYYTNIVGKYGTQVTSLLKKASGLKIRMICPLHGFVWRKDFPKIIEKYQTWAQYLPEEQGVMIAYASIYGHTENAANILSSKLRDRGIKTEMFDVSVTAASEIVSAAFRWSHLVFAAPTYNAGIFVSMEALLLDIAAHNLQNRTVALLENGSWAPTAGGLMRKILEPLKNTVFVADPLTIRSSLHPNQEGDLDALADALLATFPQSESLATDEELDPSALYSISYGLFVLSSRDGAKDNGCIVNTVIQITDQPKCITVAVNKENLTCSMIEKTKQFSVSILTESTPMDVFRRFGFESGRNADKFEGIACERGSNGILHLTKYTNAILEATVLSVQDVGTHLVFLARVTGAKVLSRDPSVTYAYYFAHIKPKPPISDGEKKGFVCKICGYVYEGETLPSDFVCPLCKHGASDFEPLK